MKLTIEKQPISTGEVTVVATAEQPVQCDVLLPDYYPDIARILCCNVTGVLTNTQSRGDKLNIDGMAVVNVSYSSEDGGLRATEYRLPFVRTVSLRDGFVTGAIDVCMSSTTTTCRAVSRRRMDITGNLSIIVRVTDVKEVEVICNTDGMGVQLQKAEGVATKIVAQLTRPVQIADQFPLPPGITPPLAIVSTHSTPILDECKLVGGRIVVKGSVETTILCQELQEDKRVVVLKRSLPLTSLLEVPNVGENPKCEICANVVSCEANYQGEYNPEDTNMNITARLDVNAKIFTNYNYMGVNDTYSTRYEIAPTYQVLNIPQMNDLIFENSELTNSFQMPEGIIEIINIVLTPTHITASVEDGKVIAGCRMMASMLGKHVDNTFECFERQWEIKESLNVPLVDGKLEMLPCFEQRAVSWSVSGDILSVKLSIQIKASPVFYKKVKLLTMLNADCTKPLDQDISVGLMIYYPTPGELVWDIAKRYSTNSQLIIQQNQLETAIIRDSNPLIIPTA